MSAARSAAAWALANAAVGGERRSTLRLQGGRIVDMHVAPRRTDLVLDLGGDRVLPGLINSHDHLQLNSFPVPYYPRTYRSSTEWIQDFNARLRDEPAMKTSAAVPRNYRLLAGGLKNLLAGVTTVAHHDPLDEFLRAEEFPTGVLCEFGWSHSLYVDGAESVRASCAATPTSQPWIIHAAEGVDPASHAEFEQLAALGCLRTNTLLVHALALDGGQRRRLHAAGAGVIWCPSSNLRLFGRTAEVGDLMDAGRVALGTDSRLTGSADLLAELRAAAACLPLDEPTLERIVTRDAARLLKLKGRGVLERGAHADLVVLPDGMPLSAARRADLRLVVRDGRVQYGDADYVSALAPVCEFVEVHVDGRPKLLQRQAAAGLLSGMVDEPGVSVAVADARAVCA